MVTQEMVDANERLGKPHYGCRKKMLSSIKKYEWLGTNIVIWRVHNIKSNLYKESQSSNKSEDEFDGKLVVKYCASSSHAESSK